MLLNQQTFAKHAESVTHPVTSRGGSCLYNVQAYHMDQSDNCTSCKWAGHIPDVDGGVGEEGHVGGELAPEPVSRESRAQLHHFT